VSSRAVMVLGTTSGAGKSFLATALCRWYARQGLKVVPFKAQNMSNNARVVPSPSGEPGEIGSAQYFQALAAGVEPDVRMNPVLLKPESDTTSQVVVLGRARTDLASVPWRERSDALWPFAREALQSLMQESDVIVIEGAGSPAEINLRRSDFVNMRTARAASAACLLVTDIDRGGAFAHLYGTIQLLPPDERASIRGFVLNRFRGDPSLLAPGPEDLQRATGVPTLAVLPLWREHGLPEEDGIYDRELDDGGRTRVVAVVAYPRISNLDELQALRRVPGLRLRWAKEPADLASADIIVLPGSKQTSSDLAWLRARRLEEPIIRHANVGVAVLGICGGLQMLGERLEDPDGIDGAATGLGLLPLVTTFEPAKLLRRTHVTFGDAHGPWQPLSGTEFDGYEIRHGRTRATSDNANVVARSEAGDAIGWQRAGVVGLSAHGVFESPRPARAMFGVDVRTLDSVFDGLADFIDERFAAGALMGLVSS
jgi:adenosylcobyric acid synthase